MLMLVDPADMSRVLVSLVLPAPTIPVFLVFICIVVSFVQCVQADAMSFGRAISALYLGIIIALLSNLTRSLMHCSNETAPTLV